MACDGNVIMNSNKSVVIMVRQMYEAMIFQKFVKKRGEHLMDEMKA